MAKKIVRVKMKIFYLFTFLFLLSFQVYAQIDTTEYFPLKTGNYWEYWGIENLTTDWFRMSIESIGDTIFPNGKTYQVLKELTYLDTINPSLDYFYLRTLGKKIFKYFPDDSCGSAEYLFYDFNASDSSIWEICFVYPSNHRSIINTKTYYSSTLNLEYEGKYFGWVDVNGADTIWEPMGSPYVDRVGKGIGIMNRFIWDYTQFILYGAKINNQIYGNLTSIKDEYSSLNSFELEQNYPNPFNPNTTISFRIPYSGIVNLKVYDVLGEELTTLIKGFKTAGIYKINFDGSKLSSGIYFYSLIFGNNVLTKKMLLVK